MKKGRVGGHTLAGSYCGMKNWTSWDEVRTFGTTVGVKYLSVIITLKQCFSESQ